MPFKKGKSRKVISDNISEFHRGQRFKKVAHKHGKKKAHKMAVAAAFSMARRNKKK